MTTHAISPKKLLLSTVEKLLRQDVKLVLSEESRKRIIRGREYLDRKMIIQQEPVYGINTGFGALHNKSIPKDQLNILQHNLVMSHACGTGAPIPEDIVKLMLLLKIQSLSYGNSGVQALTVLRLMDFFNESVLPVVYEMGSLGASGDLAPLAHLSLPLIGEGEVWFEGQKIPSYKVLANFGWDSVQLQSKEGLALLNGTQFMSAYGVYCLIFARRLYHWANIIGALSLDAFDGRIEPFHSLIQEVRPHPGQARAAKEIRKLLENSELINRSKDHVQDPYSFRCIPQVHGASLDAIEFAEQVFSREINAVTDNPTIFPEQDLIISAGNFHGQPLALALDFLGIALAELGNISERRTYQLISGARGLPSFLVKEPGLNSGFMLPQYTAASMVSQNKQLATPASVDSIESSNGQEDHVSMGANAGIKALKILENLERILAIELMNATQALEFRRPLRTSGILEDIIEAYRKQVPFIKRDTVMYPHIEKSVEFLRNYSLRE